MELRRFFRNWLFAGGGSLETLSEEAFQLVYHIPGLTLDNVSVMQGRERKWWLKRLYKQKEDESAAIEKARGK